MKTTIEIADGLLAEAKRHAAAQGMTLRALIEDALREAMDRHAGVENYRLEDVSYGSGGMTPAFAESGWEAIRDEIYRGRGA